MELVPLTKSIPETEPKIRVYRRYVVLNAAAVRLLGLKDRDYVQVAHPVYHFNKELYIRRTSLAVGSYTARVQKGKGTMRLSSMRLSALVAEYLNGYGCYLISPKGPIEDENGTYYNIFFKNYDKKDTD